MSLGCCCDTGGGTKIYGYTGIPYILSNKKFTSFPGSQINPLYSDTLPNHFDIDFRENFIWNSGFRYGYEIDGLLSRN